jgi:hypothetical protein
VGRLVLTCGIVAVSLSVATLVSGRATGAEVAPVAAVAWFLVVLFAMALPALSLRGTGKWGETGVADGDEGDD